MTKIKIPKIIPVFPLPATVLLPKTHLPLHVFEPRYREMVRDAVESDRLIGMVLLKEDWEEEYHQNPRIHEIGCVGRMLYVQPFEDGRFNIVLYGLARVQIRDQFFDKNYRQAWVEPLGYRKDEAKLPPVLRQQLISRLRHYGELRSWQRQIESVVGLNLDDERLVNLFSAELDFTPLEKQFLLESDSVLIQAKRLLDLIEFYIEERRALQKRMILPPDPERAS